MMGTLMTPTSESTAPIAMASRMSPALNLAEMPSALLDRLQGDPLVRVESLLRLLGPWTTDTVTPQTASFVMVR